MKKGCNKDVLEDHFSSILLYIVATTSASAPSSASGGNYNMDLFSAKTQNLTKSG
jgi:hypothetical protein